MKTVIFDFFGVLHEDPLKLWIPGLPESKHRLVANSAKRLDLGHINVDDFINELSALSGHSVGRIRKKFSEAQLNRGLVAEIKNLKGTYRIGLLSNANTKELHPILDKHGLWPLFDKIVISSDVGMVKPEKEIFMHALNELGARAEDTVFIDDNHHNVLSAENLGIKAVLFEGNINMKGILCVE